MVEAVRALRAIRVRPLKVNVGADRESHANHCVASLNDAVAANTWLRHPQPRFHRVGSEGVIRPFRYLVAESVDVLHRPAVTAVGRVKSARQHVRGPQPSLHWLIAVTVLAVGGSVETECTAVERIVALVKQDILRQV